MPTPSRDELILRRQIESDDLLEKLIVQLHKDADLSGVSFQGNHMVSAEQLVQHVYAWLLNLITNDFGSYMNFLYRVDIPEYDVRSIGETEPHRIAQKVTIMVLQRELKKVVLRNKNQ